MVLPGLRLAIPVGYITGVFILDRPWGKPKFRWCCIPLILSTYYFPWFLFMNVDIIYHHQEKLASFTGSTPDRVDKLVAVVSYLVLIVSSFAMRIAFAIRGRQICDLLGRFKLFAKHRLGYLGANSGWDSFFAILVFFTTFAVGIMEGVDCYLYGKGHSWIREQLGVWPHSVAVVVMFVLPTMIPMQCAFAVIVTFTGYLSVTFHDYCQYVLDLVTERKWPGMSIIAPMATSREQKRGGDGVEKRREDFTEDLRREVIAKFEIVREIFDLTQDVISPMALVLLAGSSTAVMMKAYEIILLRKNYILMARDICHLANYICYYWILQCGQRVADQVAAMKAKLDDALMDLSSDTHYLEKQTLRDVQSVIKFWNWKFTAHDIFVIDRSLAAGVVSLIMPYVVVLVQLKVSDSPESVS